MNPDYIKVLDKALDRLDADFLSQAGDAARWVRQAIEGPAAAGKHWAVIARQAAEEDGHRRALNARHKQRDTVLVSYHGVPRQEPRRRGVATRRPDTGEVGFQQKLWVDMPLAELRQRRADLIRQGAALGVEMELNDRAIEFMEQFRKKHPKQYADNKTLGQILKAAGTTLEDVLGDTG